MSFLWISILFSLLHIASHVDLSAQLGVLESAGLSKPAFLSKAAEAIVTGRYQKGKQYSVEALLLYAVCKYMEKEDPDADAWMVMGMCTRLAMRMGYHRDPRHLPDMSPFESEIRRRTFFVVEAFDLLLSFQAGLPPIMQEVRFRITLPP